MKRLNRSMTEGPLLPNIILYTIPIILTTILQLLFNAADMIVVGNFCGSISLAAVGATGAITNLVTNLFIGMSVGVGVTAAQNIGAGNDYMVQRTVHTALPVAVICGLILSVIGVIFAEPLLRLMGTPETYHRCPARYGRIHRADDHFRTGCMRHPCWLDLDAVSGPPVPYSRKLVHFLSGQLGHHLPAGAAGLLPGLPQACAAGLRTDDPTITTPGAHGSQDR